MKMKWKENADECQGHKKFIVIITYLTIHATTYYLFLLCSEELLKLCSSVYDKMQIITHFESSSIKEHVF